MTAEPGQWVRRASQDTHQCPAPVGSFGGPTAARGDLWRCGCGTLWRVGLACRTCEAYGNVYPHMGQHLVGKVWLPATWWQRIRYRKARMSP